MEEQGKYLTATNKLLTDELEEKYGKISVRVLRHDDEVREVHIVDASGISRTYAITLFPEGKERREIDTIDAKIREGNPIGRTFRECGYSVRRNVIDACVLELPEWLKDEFATNEACAAALLFELYVKKEKYCPMIYGTTLEIYSPDFWHPAIYKRNLPHIQPTTESLEKVGVSKEDIWIRIGSENNRASLQDQVTCARKDSLVQVSALKRRMEYYMAPLANQKAGSSSSNGTGWRIEQNSMIQIF